MTKKGFTIFEILAVLTVISIALVVVVGSYNAWATVYALDGAAQTLEAGLTNARATAKAKNTYVMFYYATEGQSSNTVKLVSSFQSFICTNSTESISAADPRTVSDVLTDCSGYPCLAACEITEENSDFTRQFIPLASQQRLTGHIELGYVREEEISQINDFPFQPYGSGGLVIFRPDGSVWAWNDQSEHVIIISTRKLFATQAGQPSRPLRRILRVNLATGMVTALKPEELP